MKINLSKDNPFYKYSNKNIIKETYNYNDKLLLEEFNDVEIPDTQITGNQATSILNKIKNTLISSNDEMIQFEKNVLYNYIPELFKIFRKDVTSGKYFMNPLKTVNNIMNKKYEFFFKYNEYNDELNQQENSVMEKSINYIDTKGNNVNLLIYNIFNDLYTTISNSIYKNDEKEFTNKIKIMDELIKNFTCNLYFVTRLVEQLVFDCLMQSSQIECIDDVNEHHQAMEINSTMGIVLDEYLSKIKQYVITTDSIVNSPKQIINSILKSDNLNLIHTENYLDTLKNELKNQIDIIIMSNELSVIPSLCNDDKLFFLKEVSRNNIDIFNIIDALNGTLKQNNLSYYNKDYSLYLDERDIVIFCELTDYITKMY
jgi:hypothetical protein